jgi:hypothetical protein
MVWENHAAACGLYARKGKSLVDKAFSVDYNVWKILTDRD